MSLALEQDGLRGIVVGGMAVAIYTKKAETSFDVDFVVPGARLAAVECFRELGLQPGKSAGVWYFPRLSIPVEIPDNVLAGDLDRVVDIQLDNGLLVPVIGIDDLVLDRAEQAAAQKSPSSDVRRQAILLMATYWDELDWPYIEAESRKRDIDEYLSLLKVEARGLK